MTVTSTASVKQYTGNGATTAYSFPYKTFNSTDFIVTILNSSTLLVTTQVNGGSGTYDYTVAVASDKNSATITFTTAPLSTHKITIERKMSLTQSTDYTPNDNFPAETHEQVLDERTLMIQQVQNSYELNTFRFDKNVTDAGTVEINKTVAERGDKLLAFDTAGDLTATQEIGTHRGNWASAAAYTVRDLVKDASNNNVYICNTSHTSSGSTPVSSNTDVAKWTLIIDAAAAATSATSAASSATSAASSATSAASSATAAASDATSSASSASNASSSASAAASSATAAAASADAVDDLYLGAKSSDPTLDNDGDALTTGDLYFNTASNILKVYTGSAWTAAALDASVLATLTGTETLTNKTVKDDSFYVVDQGDVSKKIAFQASGISTSNTRTITMPDSDVTLVASALANVVEDTSPQLGADLDVQGYGVTSSSSIMHPSLTSTGKALVMGF
jgi:hypothetical protein